MKVKTKKSCVVISMVLSFLLASLDLSAQERKTGLLINDSIYSSVPLIKYGKSFADTFKQKVSLKIFCPVIRDQGSLNSCTGWAVGYAAFTITHCANQNITDSAAKNELAFSAMFLYCKVISTHPELSCNGATSLVDALNLLKDTGNCRFHSFNPKSCETAPSKENASEAYQYRIAGYKGIFDRQYRPDKKIDAIIKTLSKNVPVIVAMQITPSFFETKSKQWSPGDKDSITGNHAMVVIGYNNTDQTVELMNSYGDDWRDNGFFSMSYKDFCKMTLYGFILQIPQEKKHP